MEITSQLTVEWRMESLTVLKRAVYARLSGNGLFVGLFTFNIIVICVIWKRASVHHQISCSVLFNSTDKCQYRQNLNDSTLSVCLNETFNNNGKERIWFHVSGDSRTRQIFLTIAETFGRLWSTANISHVDPMCEEKERRDHCHMNVSFPGHKFSLTERWYPTIENQRMQEELEVILNYPDHKLPDIVIANSGAWLVHTCFRTKINDTECFRKYRSMMETVMPLLARLAQRTKVVWMPQNRMKRDWGPQKTDHGNDLLRTFNEFVFEQLRGTDVVYWKSYNRIYDCFGDTEDGIHVGPKSMPWMINILLEYICKNRFDNSFQCCY